MTTALNRDQEPFLGIASDLPRLDPELDEFGYAHFSCLLAKALLETPSPQGLVMAIHGRWGSGKSTVLNFIKHRLKQVEPHSQPQVIEFNPWWFEDRKHLAAQFLSLYARRLKLESSGIAKAGDLMAEYAESLGKAVAFSTGYAWLDGPLGTLLKRFKSSAKDVPSMKNEIAAALRAGNRRYIFMIDDLDRLAPDEVLEVFKVIKALADFPNTLYLLAFDREVVARALTHPERLDGDAYLEKIVQAPFSLPPISPEKLEHKLFADLGKLIKDPDRRLINPHYWNNVYRRGMKSLLSKPRDIIRYTNVLCVTYPAVQNEVNPVDFFALELLRLTLPQLYGTIRDNPSYFAGSLSSGHRSREQETLFHDKWTAQLDERIRDDVREMLNYIFPRSGGKSHDHEFLSQWRQDRRAASPDVFPLYFSFSPMRDRVSRTEMLDFIAELSDKSKTRTHLLNAAVQQRLDDSTKARELLALILDFRGSLDRDSAANLIYVLADIGDQLLSEADERSGSFGSYPSRPLIDALDVSLGSIPKGDRDRLLLEAFKDGKSLASLCHLMGRIAHFQVGSEDQRAPLSTISEETRRSLQSLALARIRERSSTRHFLETRCLRHVLRYWEDCSTPEEVRTWADQALSASNAAAFLFGFVDVHHTPGLMNGPRKSEFTLDFGALRPLIDMRKMAHILNASHSIAINSQNEGHAVAAFKAQYRDLESGQPHGPRKD